MKNLKQLGILASTALLSMALLASCSGDTDESTTPDTTEDSTSGQTENNTGAGDPLGDMSLEAEDETEEESEEEEEIPSDEDIENSDPNATPPEEETPEEPEPEATPEVTPAPAPEAEESKPEEEATPEVTPEPEAPTGNAVNLYDFYKSTIASHEFGMVDQVTGEYLTNFYPGLENIQTNQMEIYMSMMTASAVEIALVEVANAGDAAAVQNVFQTRIDYQAGEGAWYPEAKEAWANNSAVVVKGNYVMMVVHDNKDAIVSSFNALF